MALRGWWTRGLAAAVLLAWAGNASGQSVDTSMARAEVDRPLSMSVLVRAFDWPAGRMTPECLQVRIQQGESGETVAPLRLRTIPSGDDGQVVVQISSPQRVTDTVLTGQLRLLCGADYTREFTVLADPPTASPATAGTSTAWPPTPHRSAAPTPRPTTSSKGAQSITRSDRAATTSAEANRQGMDETTVRQLVAAVVSALHRTSDTEPPFHAETTTVPPAALTTAAHPSSDAAWQALQEEQRQTRTAVAALLARIERTEQPAGNVWRDASLVAGGVFGLLSGLVLVRLLREGRLSRFSSTTAGTTAASAAFHLRRQRARWQAEEERQTPHPAPHTAVDRPAATPHDPGMFPWSPPSPTGSDGPALPSSPAARSDDPNAATRWPDADFGHPSLDHATASADLLAELAPLVAESPIGVALVLERRLQASREKCPWVLLRLLDLYREMAQPWNHERVAAQLEALYNLRIPSMVSEAPSDDGGLEACPETLAAVLQAWSQDEPASALARLLMHPAATDTLEQPVFEDVLLLHGIAQHRRFHGLATIEGSVQQPPPPAPMSSTPGRNRLMELLAA